MVYAMGENSQVGRTQFVSMISQDIIPSIFSLELNRNIPLGSLNQGTRVSISIYISPYSIGADVKGFSIKLQSVFVIAGGTNIASLANPLANPGSGI
jgi:hypothetical protein